MANNCRIILLSLGIASCSLADVEQAHHKAVVNGYKKLPIAESLKNKFGGWSFITHWNIKNDPKYGRPKNERKWHTNSFIYGRYSLSYVQNVFLTKNGGQVTSLSEGGKIYLLEMIAIDKSSRATDFGSFQHVIEGEDIKKLVASDWDFSVLGFQLKKQKPLKNIEWKYAYWSRIYPLQPFTPNVSREHYRAVLSGYKKLPIAESLKKKFGAWSSIAHRNIKNDPKDELTEHKSTWQTKSIVYDRYSLSYEQNVVLSENGEQVTSLSGGEKIHLKEMKSVHGDKFDPAIDYRSFQPVIEGEDIKKLVASDWDFSVLGFQLKTQEPLENMKWVHAAGNRMHPLQPFTLK